jgi:hypothetical protein
MSDPPDLDTVVSAATNARIEELNNALEDLAREMTDDSTADETGAQMTENPHSAVMPSSDTIARRILTNTGQLVDQERDTHGDALENHRHIAEGWTWYLEAEGVLAEGAEVEPAHVARMMELLKMSRGAVGKVTLDHDRDTAGYAGIAGAIEVLEGEAEMDDLRDVGEEIDG